MAGEDARLTLDLWRPSCWAIGLMSKYDGGILTHVTCDAPVAGAKRLNELFTVHGGSLDEVETLLDVIANSELTGEVLELQERLDPRGKHVTPGLVAHEFLLEYDPGDMTCPELFKQGSVRSAPM